jgi:hypothetical protein
VTIGALLARLLAPSPAWSGPHARANCATRAKGASERRRERPALWRAVAGAAAFVTLAALAAGCGSSASTTVYTPLTGLEIPASLVTAGHGCGTLPLQIYKYAVVVSSSPADAGVPALVTAGVFDCFTDAVFSNLPSLDGGVNPTYYVSIYAFNFTSFPLVLNCTTGAAPCPGDEAGAVAPWTASANWTGSCTGTQVAGVTASVTCTALTTSPALTTSLAFDGSTDDGSTAFDGSTDDRATDASAVDATIDDAAASSDP